MDSSTRALNLSNSAIVLWGGALSDKRAPQLRTGTRSRAALMPGEGAFVVFG